MKNEPDLSEAVTLSLGDDESIEADQIGNIAGDPDSNEDLTDNIATSEDLAEPSTIKEEDLDIVDEYSGEFRAF